MSSALLLIDFINENVSFEGKMAKKGYPDYCQKNNTLSMRRNCCLNLEKAII